MCASLWYTSFPSTVITGNCPNFIVGFIFGQSAKATCLSWNGIPAGVKLTLWGTEEEEGHLFGANTIICST